MTRGKFIVIEGGDGAGKDTQIELLKKEFARRKNIIFTRDPGGTRLGMELRQTLQHGDTISHEAEMLLFLASRAQLVSEVIVPNTEKGVHVISNRFDPSTIAYQIYGRRRTQLEQMVKAVSAYANINVVPDLVILLDVTPSVGLSRTRSRGEKLSRFEQEELDFHERVRQGYRAAVKDYPNVVTINADESPEAVYRQVLSAIEKELGK